MPRLNRILALKDLGLSLDQIGQLLEDNLPADQIRGMLRLKQVELQERLEEGQARLARVEWRLKQIEKEGTMSSQEVVLKKVPALTVASVRDVIPTYRDIERLFGEIFAHLGQHKVSPAGPPVAIYHDEEFRLQDADVEVAAPVTGEVPAPVTGEVPAGDRVKTRELPAVEEMASIVHQGSYESIGEAYNRLMAWIEANGYRITGPCREVYVRGPESDDDASTYVTEVQFPVEKA